MLNCVVLSLEEAEAGLETAGSGGRVLASRMGPGQEGEPWEGMARRGWGSEDEQPEWHDWAGGQVGASPAFGFWSHSSDAAPSPL